MSIRTKLEKILLAWLKKWNHLPDQGSKAWLKGKTKTVGGSEFDALIKGSLGQLVKSKLGYRLQLDMIPMMLGNVFEPLLRMISSIIVGSEIYEAAGSIPSAEVVGKTYSMDGIGVIYHKDIKKYLITLVEFKCIWSRKIIQNKCPDTYIPQILSGMSDLTIPERALFIESMFRVCSFDDLDFNIKYNNLIYKNKLDDNIKKPLIYGYMGLYIPMFEDGTYPDPELSIGDQKFYYKIMQQSSDTIIDWGDNEHAFVFQNIIKLIKIGVIKVRYSPMNATRGSEWKRIKWFETHDAPVFERYKYEKKDFKDWTDENKHLCIGVMGWKIFDMNLMTIEKEMGYTKKYEKLITEFIKTIDELYKIEDLTERYNLYLEKFETNDDGTLKSKKNQESKPDCFDAINKLFDTLNLSESESE